MILEALKHPLQVYAGTPGIHRMLLSYSVQQLFKKEAAGVVRRDLH